LSTKIIVHVKPNARKNEVTKLEGNTYRVSVTAPPIDGKANEKVIEVLAAYFKKPKRCFVIARGATAREKVVEVGDR
jgi:hypothetical protein